MSSAATSTDAPFPTRPRLALVHTSETQCGEAEWPHEPAQREYARDLPALGGHLSCVLVAGADAATRSRMLGELRKLLPTSTPFLEARETWELLAHAASSRMVVLTDDLGAASAESLIRLLGRRHPALPVLSIGGPTGEGAPVGVESGGI